MGPGSVPDPLDGSVSPLRRSESLGDTTGSAHPSATDSLHPRLSSDGPSCLTEMDMPPRPRPENRPSQIPESASARQQLADACVHGRLVGDEAVEPRQVHQRVQADQAVGQVLAPVVQPRDLAFPALVAIWASVHRTSRSPQPCSAKNVSRPSGVKAVDRLVSRSSMQASTPTPIARACPGPGPPGLRRGPRDES